MTWIQNTLTGSEMGIVFFAAVFLLGILGAVSSCCTLPVLGAVLGYAGSRAVKREPCEILMVGLFFMFGTTISLVLIGFLSGLLGQLAGAAVGRYWQFASGLLIVFFGLVSLNLVKIRIPTFNVSPRIFREGMVGAMVYGAVLGGASTACSLGCNPLLPAVIAAVIAQGAASLGAAALFAFALGYSLPLTAGLIGITIGLERLYSSAHSVVRAVQYAAGFLLILVGFYLLATT